MPILSDRLRGLNRLSEAETARVTGGHGGFAVGPYRKLWEVVAKVVVKEVLRELKKAYDRHQQPGPGAQRSPGWKGGLG